MASDRHGPPDLPSRRLAAICRREREITERIRSASLRLAGPAGADADTDALADPRMALRLRRARAWLEARCAGTKLSESLLLEAMRSDGRREVSPQAMARARAIALSLKRALES